MPRSQVPGRRGQPGIIDSTQRLGTGSSQAIPVPFGRPLPPTCWPNGTGMGVPTPAPGVGTFRTPLTGASRARQSGP